MKICYAILALSFTLAYAAPQLVVNNKTQYPDLYLSTATISGTNVVDEKAFHADWVQSGEPYKSTAQNQDHAIGAIEDTAGDFSTILSRDDVEAIALFYYTPDVAGSSCPANQAGSQPCFCSKVVPISGSVYSNTETYKVTITGISDNQCSVSMG